MPVAQTKAPGDLEQYPKLIHPTTGKASFLSGVGGAAILLGVFISLERMGIQMGIYFIYYIQNIATARRK